MPIVPPQVEGGGGVSASWGPLGLSIKDDRPRPIWVKITGQASSTNRYAWTQIDDGDTSGTFGTNLSSDFAASGTSDEAGGCAYEITGSTSVATNSKQLLWPAGDGSFWVFKDGGSGSDSDPAGYRISNTPTSIFTVSALPQILTVPRGSYLVVALMSSNFSGGAGNVHYGIGVCNEGATPASPKIPSTPVRLDAQANDHTPLTLVQMFSPGEFDDDGGTANVDIKVYQRLISGTMPASDVKQFCAVPVSSVTDG